MTDEKWWLRDESVGPRDFVESDESSSETPLAVSAGECRIRKRKRQGGHGLWGGYEIARDEHGVWLYTPEGSGYVGTNVDGSIATCFAGQPDPPGLHVMLLVPARAAWWVGHWKVYRGDRTLSIDICMPAEVTEGEWSYVDLELDLYKSDDGTCGVFDEDEFEEAIAQGLISDDEARTCRHTAEQLASRIRTSDAVFDDLAWRRLKAAKALNLSPIPDPSAQMPSQTSAE